MSKVYSFLVFCLLVFIKGFTDPSLPIKDESIIEVIILMFFGGFLTTFTPCVYPLIPVTIGIISGINKERRRSPFFLSLIYSLGIIITYTTLGIIAGVGSLTFGSYMGNTLFLWILSIIFFLLGLSMVGFYEIQLPQSISRRLVNIKGSNLISIFLMGLVAGFVAAPCTGPILASALIYISTGGSPLLGGVYLFSYASGLSIVFIIAGSFSNLLTKLPKSGRWMIVVRSIFAVVIISYSLYLLNTAYEFVEKINDFDRYHITGVIMFIIGIIGGGLTREVDFSPFRIKLIKLLMVMLLSLSILSFILTDHQEDKINWITDYEIGIKKAREEHLPVIIDFYANWCGACKEIKKKTIPDNRIQKEAERFVMILIDVTDPDERILELKRIYRVSGLPSIIFLDSDLNEVESIRITGFVDADEFLKRMRSVR